MSYDLPQGLTPQHPISAMTFAPPVPNAHASQEPHRSLLVSSWDKTVRLYRLPHVQASDVSDAPAAVQLVHTFQHDAAVLDVCWITPTLAASGGLDRRVRLLNLQTGQSTVLGKHSLAVNRLRYCPASQLLITTSWDESMALWAVLSEPRQLHHIKLPFKPLALDVSPPPGGVITDETPRAVIAMTGRSVYIYETKRLRTLVDRKAAGETIAEADWTPAQTRESTLKFMVRDVRCMPDGEGYASSSVEGRIAVDFFNGMEEAESKKYAFKCHRAVVDGIDTVYPVNCMAFHPTYGTFASLGGDAMVSVWDAAARKRRLQYPRFPSPLTAGAVSADGHLAAFASGGENVEDTRHVGPGAGEVGEVGRGGEGNVCIHIRSAKEDFKPKAKTAA